MKRPLLSYFEKIAHMSVLLAHVSLWLCIFVTLYARMVAARANKVEGTMSWGLETNEILASIKHGIAKGRTRALWDRHLDSSQFFRLLLRLQVFGRITLNIFMIQTLCTVMQLFKGSYFRVDAASRLTEFGYRERYIARIYDFCFTCFKVEYKRSYIFKALPMIMFLH